MYPWYESQYFNFPNVSECATSFITLLEMQGKESHRDLKVTHDFVNGTQYDIFQLLVREGCRYTSLVSRVGGIHIHISFLCL